MVPPLQYSPFKAKREYGWGGGSKYICIHVHAPLPPELPCCIRGTTYINIIQYLITSHGYLFIPSDIPYCLGKL